MIAVDEEKSESKNANSAALKATLHSCLYVGEVVHQRLLPTEHRFRYPLSWAYLDLDELDEVTRSSWLFSQRRFAPLSFRPQDHARGQAASCDSLQSSIRALIATKTGNEPLGPIRLLTPLRHFGIFFSPLCLYFCFASHSEEAPILETIVAEVTNTPWGERHFYVLDSSHRINSASDGSLAYEHDKAFHVSPFMGMRQQYRWRVTVPGDNLSVSLRSTEDAVHIFTAAIRLHRHPIGPSQLAKMLLRFPFTPWQMLSAIYFEAWRLWKKKVPYHPHPNSMTTTTRPKTG